MANLNQVLTNKIVDFITRKILLMLQAKSAEWPQKHCKKRKKTRATEDGAINNDIYQYAGLIIQLITIWYRALFCFPFSLVSSGRNSFAFPANFLWRTRLFSNCARWSGIHWVCPATWPRQALKREKAKNKGTRTRSWSDDILRLSF